MFAVPFAIGAQTYHFESNSPPVYSTTLTPGMWTLAVTGGGYDQVAGAVSGCDQAGGNCYVGWHTEYFYRLDGGTWTEAGFNGSWATPSLALQNAPAPEVFDVDVNTQLEFTLLDSSPDEVVDGRAVGYLWRGSAGYRNGEYLTFLMMNHGDRGIVSTALDLAKWDTALSGGGPLTKATRDSMWTSIRLNNGSSYGYGLGWSSKRSTATRIFSIPEVRLALRR